MLSRNEIKDYIESELRIPVTYETKKVAEYGAKGYPFYLKKNNKRPLVIHPDFGSGLRENPIRGVELEHLYHNSNLRAFPKVDPDKQKCGYDLQVADVFCLKILLERIGALSAPHSMISNPLDDIEEVKPTLATLTPTQRETLIQARLGQGQFRDCLMSVWKCKCAVTGVDVPALLRASHIKPWRLSDNSERLDPENGLLLVANLDAAFDAGLLSFSDEGKIIFSSNLGPAPHDLLGIRPGATLATPPSRRQQVFLHHHRMAAKLE